MSKEKKNQETQETTVEIISEQAKKLADQVEALMKDGKSMAEALQAVIPKSTGRAGIDHVALINSMNNLEELRKAKKTAHAKKSKSKDKPEAAARYQLEIDAATARINEIIAEINRAEIPWKKALEYGDTIDGALQYYIQDTEATVSAELEKLTAGCTKAVIKTFVNESHANFDSVPEPLREGFKRRLKNNDQRIRTLAHKLQAVIDIKAGTRKPGKAEETAQKTEATA